MFFGLNDVGFLAAVSAGPALWTPANITTALWLDAADASAITESSGAVSQWNDKSGNGRNATQATLGFQPAVINNQYSGKAAIRSDGVDDFLSIAPFSVSAGIRAYGVVNAISPSPDRRNGDWLWMTDFLTTSPHYGGDPSDWFSSFFSTSRPRVSVATPNNSLKIAYIEQTGSELKCRVFGAFTERTASAVFNGSPTAKFQVFSNPAGFSSIHDICEIVFIQSPLTDQQTKTEGYLAHKWGLTADLPNDHPYKTAAPTL
jgi:hypothetical protein